MWKLYIYIYIYIYVYTHACVYIYIYIYIFVNAVGGEAVQAAVLGLLREDVAGARVGRVLHHGGVL